MIRLAILTVALAVGVPLALADDKAKDDKEKVTFEPVHLSVSRLGKEQNFGDRLTVEFRVTLPGKHILGVHPTSKVTTLGDDKGNSMIGTKASEHPKFGPFPRIAKDRTSMIIISGAYQAPTRGALKILLKGDLVVSCGAEEKSTEETTVAFTEKVETKVGDLVLLVAKEKGSLGGGDFHISGPVRGVKEISVTEDGKAVEVFTAGSSFLGAGKYRFHFSLKKVVKEAKVKITYFAKEENVKVPVDLTFTAGL